MRSAIAVLAVIGLAALVAFGYFCVSMMQHGYSARENPSGMETFLARHARSMATPTAAKAMKNPYAADPQSVAAGRDHWIDHCAQCHGVDGSGNTDVGRNVYPKAPDMRAAPTQNLSDGEIYYIIANGVRFTGMPAWGGEHSPEETWQLVSFIRHLPHLTPEELEQMKRQAPAGAAEGEHHRHHGTKEEHHEHEH